MNRGITDFQRFLLLILLSAALLQGCDRPSFLEDRANRTSAYAASGQTPVLPDAADTVVKVRRADLSAPLKVRGRVASESEFSLSFPRGGWLKSLDVRVGDQVEKGAPLAELEDPDLEDQVHSATSRLEAARAALAQAKLPPAPGKSLTAAESVTAAQRNVDIAALRLARLKAPPKEDELTPYRVAIEKARVAVAKAQDDYDQYPRLRSVETSPEGRALRLATLDLEVAQANLARVIKGPRAEDLAMAEADVRSAEAALQVAIASYNYEVQVEEVRALQQQVAIAAGETEVGLREAEVERLRSRMEQTKLAAPFSGSIVSLEARVGDQVRPFQTLGVLANPNKLEVEATVPEEDILQVYVGQEAQVVMDGFPSQRYKAQVRQVASKPTLWQGKQVYQARLAFSNVASVPATIRMGADIYLSVNKSKVLVVPVASLHSDGSKRYVEVSAGNGTRKVPVTVGLTGDSEAEIVTGLREGDPVLVPAEK